MQYQLVDSQRDEGHHPSNGSIKNKIIGESKAQLLRRKLDKNVCRFFEPFYQYFMKNPVQYIVEPQSKYIARQPFQDKISLSVSKQQEYYSGSSKAYLDKNYLSSLIEEDQQDRGLFQNHKQKSLLIKNTFVYANGYDLKSIWINDNKEMMEQQKQDKNMIFEFAEPILEVVQYFDHLVIVRCRYWITLFDTMANLMVKQIRLKEEITAVTKLAKQNSLLLATYDSSQYRLYSWNPTENILSLLKTSNSIWPVNSMTVINTRQAILCFHNKIIIEDLRTNSIQNLKRIVSTGDDRFVSLAKIQHQPTMFVVSRAHYIDIFDLRKQNESILEIRHFCEEAPPSCLLSFSWVQPFLIAYSPYDLGSALLIDLQLKQNIHSSKLLQQNRNCPMLLFDSGKIYKGVHPISLTACIDSSILRIFQVDSSNGISVETLKKEKETQNQNKYKIFHLQHQGFSSYPESPVKKWIRQKSLDPFLVKRTNGNISDEGSSSEDDSIEQKQIFKKKNNYCSLEKFRNKIIDLSTRPINEQLIKNSQNGFQTMDQTFGQSLEEDNTWIDILKLSSKKNNNQHEISEDLLDFMAKEWRI